MGIELSLKHVSPWCLERLVEAPGAVEMFWVAQPHALPPTDAPIPFVSPSFKLVSPTHVMINDQWMEEVLAYARKKYPDDFARIQPHLARLLGEWAQPPLDLEKSWRWLVTELTSCRSEGASIGAEALEGGRDLGPDMGIGPARYFSAPETAELAARLHAEERAVEGIMHPDATLLFQSVVRYYQEAADLGHAMMLAKG